MVRLKRFLIGVFTSLVLFKKYKTAVTVKFSLDAIKLIQSPILFTRSSRIVLAKLSAWLKDFNKWSLSPMIQSASFNQPQLSTCSTLARYHTMTSHKSVKHPCLRPAFASSSYFPCSLSALTANNKWNLRLDYGICKPEQLQITLLKWKWLKIRLNTSSTPLQSKN